MRTCLFFSFGVPIYGALHVMNSAGNTCLPVVKNAEAPAFCRSQSPIRNLRSHLDSINVHKVLFEENRKRSPPWICLKQ